MTWKKLRPIPKPLWDRLSSRSDRDLRGRLLIAWLGSLTICAGPIHAAELILNEYNAVRASRWLDCDGLNCCCAQAVCDGGDRPGESCLDDGECSGHFECSADDGATFTGDPCVPENGDAECTALNADWTCREHTTDGACLCDPPCKEDVFFGRVPGNGGNWIELVVTQNHVDIRGWQLHWTEDRPDVGTSDVGTLTLTDDPLWIGLRAGTIITFTELDAAGGGLDTDTSYNPDAGDWWININTLSSDGTPQTRYVSTVTNVPGDGPGAFSVGNDNWQLTIQDAASSTVFGPCGEGVRFVCDGGPLEDEACLTDNDCAGEVCVVIGVNSREVFKLQEDPSPNIDPVTSNYKDGTTSTFGHPNIWSGGDRSQDFTCLRCDDGAFCNGVEECDAERVCRPGVAPCGDRRHCDEDADACLECINNAECDDGNPCTQDKCDDGVCRSSTIPGCGGPPGDTDGDGVIDGLDDCPDTPVQESVDDRGCACSQLDEDDDGVDDCTDRCPETPPGETIDAGGCSCSQLDEDGDGVDDCADACPDTPAGETVDFDGCSCLQLDPQGDDDGDGVLNCLDYCAGTFPGHEVDSEGCSCMQVDPFSDNDHDGVPNCLDECSATPADAEVDDAGCSIGPADDPARPTELPDGEGDNGNDNAVEPSDDDEVPHTVPRGWRRLCGAIGPVGLVSLIAGLLLLRLAPGYPRLI